MVTTGTTVQLRGRLGHRPSWKQFTLCLTIAFSFCQLATNNTATAATYYLDATNGSDNTDGLSVGTAWRTLSKAQATVTSGDTVIVRNGSYGAYSESGVNRTDWVTYRAAAGHTPELTSIGTDNQNQTYNTYLVFDGFTLKPAAGQQDAITIRRSKYTKFMNLNVIGRGANYVAGVSGTAHGIYVWDNSTDVNISGCILSGGVNTGRFDGFGSGIYIDSSSGDNTTIANNDIKQFKDYGVMMPNKSGTIRNNDVHYGGGDAHIFINGGTGPLLIENNKIHDLYLYQPTLAETPTATTWSADGKTMTNPSANWGANAPYSWLNDSVEIWVTSGNHVQIGDNDVRVATVSPHQITLKKSIGDGTGTPSNVNYVLIDSSHGDLLQQYGYPVSNLTVRNNQFYDCYGQFMWVECGQNASQLGTNILFENNLFWNHYASGGDTGNGEYGGTVGLFYTDGAVLRNNTVIGRLQISGNSNVFLRNNIVGYIQSYNNSLPTNSNYNIFNRGNIESVGSRDTKLFPDQSWDKWNDPTFTGIFANYANGDFSLASATSLGVGHADTANYPATDILGNSRGSSPDAGCYEYVGSRLSNNPPIADAGSDQTLTASVSGTASVTLDGSHSSSPNGSIVSYVWTEGGSQIAVDANPTVALSIGRHTITLRVTDNGGLTDTDTVVITVEELDADITPPSITSVTATESSVEIQFSEPLDGASAGSAGNYGLSDSLKINSLWPETGYNRVTLYTDMQTDGKTYTLTVANVKDVAGNPMPKTSVTYTYNSGLVGYYVFGDAGSSYVADSSGHNNTGYYINGAQRSDQQEAKLGGGDDAVQISTTDWNAAQGTVALWINGTSMLGTQYIFGHSDESEANLIQLYTDNGYLCVGMGDNHLLKTGIQLLSPQTWYHITLSWDGTNYTVYVNGSLSATGTYTGLTLLSNLADIGNAGGTTSHTEGFQGLIDEVRIYNRGLTAAEISNLALMFLPIGDKTVAEGNELSFTIRTRPDVTMTLADSNLPSLPTLVSNTFSWTPSYTDAGTYEVEFAAPHGSSMDFEKIAITVTDANLPDSNSPPIGYWKFDETSGNIASDSSAIRNTGYLKNGLTWGTGKINGAVVFSVPNDAVQIKTTNFNLQQGTVAMWVYVQRQTLSRHYFFGHITGTTNRIQLYDKYGYLCLGLGDSQETSVNIQRLQNKKWYHIVLTWNKPTYNVYVNGSLKASGTYPGLTAFADHADIGNNGLGRDMGLNGKIDDVHIYNRAITADEIIKLDVGY